MSSSGFLRGPGFFAFSTVSLDGSISWGLDTEAASGFMLYHLVLAGCHDLWNMEREI
jgi:hypothetical protein